MQVPTQTIVVKSISTRATEEDVARCLVRHLDFAVTSVYPRHDPSISYVANVPQEASGSQGRASWSAFAHKNLVPWSHDTVPSLSDFFRVLGTID